MGIFGGIMAEETPKTEEAPEAEKEPTVATEEAPKTEEAPAAEAPTEETPPAEEVLKAEQAPAAEEVPAAEEASAAEEAPKTEEVPAAEAPKTEEAPAAEASAPKAAAIETPASAAEEEASNKVKWNQHAITDDISWRGPLNYRHFKILGWMLLVIKLLLPPLTLATKIDPGIHELLATPLGILELITPLSVFFLLIASFSQLLIKRDYKKQMITYGAASLAIIVVFELLFHRYIVSAVDAFVANRDESMALLDMVFSAINPTGYLTFNVFIDLFLCTCVMFFLNYEPTKYFVGEKRKWFRYMAVLPVIFELVCLGLKLSANQGGFHMPISFFPFLPTKPPMMFFAICAMIVYQALLERRFRKEGRTHEEFEAYLDTNRNSWDFAKFAAITCLVAGLADVAIANIAIATDPEGGMGAIMAIWTGGESDWFYNLISRYFNAGFGGSTELLFFAPLMLLFNYMKTYKNTAIELAIPVVAITVLLILYLEGALFAIGEIGRFTREEVIGVAEQQLKPAITQLIQDTGRELGYPVSEREAELLLEEMLATDESSTGSIV